MNLKRKTPSTMVDFAEMKAMLKWEAQQAGDPVPYPTNAFMAQWLSMNSASAANIKERIAQWKAATDTPQTFIDCDGNQRKT